MGTRDDGHQVNPAPTSWRSQWKLIALALTLLALLGYNIASSSFNSGNREINQRGEVVFVQEVPSEIQSERASVHHAETTTTSSEDDSEMHPIEREAHELVKQLEETLKEHEEIIAANEKEEAAAAEAPEKHSSPPPPAAEPSTPAAATPSQPQLGTAKTPSQLPQYVYKPPQPLATRPDFDKKAAPVSTVKHFAEEFPDSELQPGFHPDRKYKEKPISQYELALLKIRISQTNETVSANDKALIMDQAPGDMKRAQAARRDSSGRLVTTYHHTLPEPHVETLEHSVVKIGGFKQRSMSTEIAWSLADLGKERGIVLLFHGCGHSAKTWWDLPVDRKLIRHLLHSGFSVLAFSSQDEITKCWDDRWPLESGNGQNTNVDINNVLGALQKWILREEKMDVPLFALGASSGGTFVTILSRAIYLRGSIVMISPGNDNALRTSPSQDPLELRVRHTRMIPPEISPDNLSNLDRMFNLPPLFFSYMEKDTRWASEEAIAVQAPYVTSQNPWLQPDPTKPGSTIGFLAYPVKARPLEPASLNVIDGIAEQEDCSNVFYTFAHTPTIQHFDLHRKELAREKELRLTLEATNPEAAAKQAQANVGKVVADPSPSPFLLDKNELLQMDPRNTHPVKIVAATVKQAYKENAQALKTNHPVQFTPVGESPDERDLSYKKEIMNKCLNLFYKYEREINEVLNSLYASHEMTADHAQQYTDWMLSLIRREEDPKFLTEMTRRRR